MRAIAWTGFFALYWGVAFFLCYVVWNQRRRIKKLKLTVQARQDELDECYGMIKRLGEAANCTTKENTDAEA